MKKLFLFFICIYFSYANFETNNYVGSEFRAYPKTDKYNLSLTYENQSEWKNDYFNLYLRLNATKDFKDKKRDELLLNELYLLKSLGNFDFTFGKQIVFLGSLEAKNIVNFLNPQNYKKDIFQTHKLGSFISSLKYYFKDNSSLGLYIKSADKKQKFPSKKYEGYPFGKFDYNKHIKINNGLAEALLMYSFSAEILEHSGDFAFGVYNGYDSFKMPILNSLIFDLKALRTNKIFAYSTLAINEWLLKFELMQTNPKEKGIKKFYESGIGFEYSFYDFYKSHTLGIISEYYKSNSFFTSLENDIFIALRYSLNDKDSSEFLFGFIKDIKNNDNSIYLKYDGRLFDGVKISSDVRYAKLNNKENLRFGFEIKYYF